MKYIELTLPTPAENLAADEAWLQACEAGEEGELLRIWEPREYFVVLGYANRAHTEVDLAMCERDGVPVLRRLSGGGTVLQGAGCVNYSLFLKISDSLLSINATNQFIMQRHRRAFEEAIGQPVAVQGFTDLTVVGTKFSGNAQRRKRSFLLFHGTVLFRFDLPLVEKYLRMPERQPAYRKGRSHQEFLMNLRLSVDAIRETLRKAWCADEPIQHVPQLEIGQLVKTKYGQSQWNLKF